MDGGMMDGGMTAGALDAENLGTAIDNEVAKVMFPQSSETTGEALAEPTTDPNDALDDVPEVTLDTMNNYPVLVGASGRRYRAVDLLTEMTTRHKNYLKSLIQPVLPMVLNAVAIGLNKVDSGEVSLTSAELADLLKSVSLGSAFQALVIDGLDVKLLAALFLPQEYRIFRTTTDAEDRDTTLDATIEDFQDIDSMVIFEAFRRFFTSNWSSSRATTIAFIHTMLRPRTTSSIAKA